LGFPEAVTPRRIEIQTAEARPVPETRIESQQQTA
jgi:hypothetical protein